MNAVVYKKIIPTEVIDSIIKFYDNEPEVYSESGIINKNLEYHIPENFIFQTLNPYLVQLLGNDHEFSTGAYKSSNKPYIIHVDSRVQFDKYGTMSFDSGKVKQNKAVLIPLVEGPEFRTIVFDKQSDLNPVASELEEHRTNIKNHLIPEDFTHEKMFNIINYLPIQIDYQWELGDVMTWERNQWHISSNFARFNKIKTFLVLFVA
jgi:hypothetical protein